MIKRIFGVILAAGIVSVILWWQSTPNTVPDQTNHTTQTCPETTLAEQYSIADVIVTGSVTGVLPNDQGLADVWIAPDHVYKGTVTSENIKVLARSTSEEKSQNHGTSDIDLHFQSTDPPYLLFLHTASNGRYATSRCDGSRLLGNGLTTNEQNVFGVDTALQTS